MREKKGLDNRFPPVNSKLKMTRKRRMNLYNSQLVLRRTNLRRQRQM